MKVLEDVKPELRARLWGLIDDPGSWGCSALA